MRELFQVVVPTFRSSGGSYFYTSSAQVRRLDRQRKQREAVDRRRPARAWPLCLLFNVAWRVNARTCATCIDCMLSN